MRKNMKSVQVEDKKREYVPPDLLMVDSKKESSSSNLKETAISTAGATGENSS